MKLRKSEDERAAARERRLREREQAEEQRRMQRAQMDAERAKERQKKQGQRREQAARRSATTALPNLGVTVRDGTVFKYTVAAVTGREGGQGLGELAGAHAEVTGGKGGHRRSGIVRAGDAVLATAVVGPVGLLAGVSRKGFQGTAFVIFADGTLHEKQITDEASFVKAQADAVRFNALVAGAFAPDHAADRGDIRPGTFTEEDRARETARRANELAGGMPTETGDYPPGDRDAPGYKPERRYPQP
jgi:hypothetical protein